MKFAAIYILCAATASVAFSPPANQKASINSIRTGGVGAVFLSAEPTEAVSADVDEAADTNKINDSLQIPLSYSEMIQQVSSCMSEASAKGMNRQIVRILLPRDPTNDQFGQYYEDDVDTADRIKSAQMSLVPTDESWQGGIMQLYRAASPTTKDILRQCSPTTATTGVPPKVIEDRTVDESGVDGVGLFYTQVGSGGADEVLGDNDDGGFTFFGESTVLPTLKDDDMCVFVQPSQEVVDCIDDLSTKSGSSLIALLNPQWRNVDDALDSASKSDGVFGAIASFLGGKGSVLKRLDELKYTPTYSLEGYVCKGGNIRLIKRFDSDWVAFAENDSGDSYVRVGSMPERPTYQDVEKMLDDKGVGYKYARDLGMAPKL